MSILALLFVVAILLAFQFTVFWGLSKSEEEMGENEKSPLMRFLVRRWWVVPVAIFVIGAML